MSVYQNDWYGVGATQVAVGLSQVIRVQPPSNSWGGQLKIVSGSGTLAIVAPQFSGASTQTGFATAGYVVGGTEVVQFSGPVTFYLAATSATMTVGVVWGLTNGATLL